MFRLSIHCRVLQTPTEEIWPGVSKYPDYQPTFPNWTNFNLNGQLKNITDDGIDLLKTMLIYDPMKRATAKMITKHPFFNDLDRSVAPTIMNGTD